MRLDTILPALLLGLGGCASFSPGVAASSELVLDGKVGAAEWAGVPGQQVEGGATLFTRMHGENLYVAIRLPPRAYRYADLYIADRTGRILNLHTSMRFGERVLKAVNGDKGPPFVWEPNTGWYGSTAPYREGEQDRPLTEQFHPYEGYEMRVPVRMLGPRPWTYRLELRSFGTGEGVWTYPVGSSLADWKSWPELR